MEKDKATITLPFVQNFLYTLVIEPVSEVQPTFQVVSGADVITRKHSCPSQPTKQHVLRRPAPHPAYCHQAFNTLPIVQLDKPFQIESPFDNCPRHFNDRSSLAAAIPERSQIFRIEVGQIFRTRKSIHTHAERQTTAFRKPIEENDSDRKTKLLTGNPVDQTFKDRSKAGRL